MDDITRSSAAVVVIADRTAYDKLSNRFRIVDERSYSTGTSVPKLNPFKRDQPKFTKSVNDEITTVRAVYSHSFIYIYIFIHRKR